MKTIKLFVCVALLCAVAVAGVFAGGKREKNIVQKSDVLRVGILNGPTSIPAAYLLENVPAIEGVSVSFETFADPQSLLPRMIRGEIDMAFLPPNVAAKTYNSGNAALVCVGVSGYGNLSLITKDKSITSLSNLKGKKVSVAGQGSTPEYMFRWLLREKGVPDAGGSDGVELDFSIPNPNIAAALISNQIEYAVVPEPFATVATTRSAEVIRAVDLQKEFSAVTNTENFPLTLLVASSSYTKTNVDTVKAFAAALENAVNWTKENPADAAQLVEKHTLGLAAPIVEKAIPFANFTWKNADASRTQIEMLLNIFLAFAPESIGGKLPDDGFYLK